LATLTFGLLVETLIFTQNRFLQQGVGVSVTRPGWTATDKSFAYFVLAIFLVVAIFLVNMRRSTTGLALGAARRSQAASTSVLGLNVVGLKVLISALATFVAALGGGLLAMYSGTALPTDFPTFTGLVWLAVLVTVGVRSIVAASIAGLAFTIVPGLFQTYLSGTWGNVPSVLFGLGAIGLAIDPDGSVTSMARRLEDLFSKIMSRRDADPDSRPERPEGSVSRGAGVTALAGAGRKGRS
jgi:branched-chain amino acid transport system permease protein